MLVPKFIIYFSMDKGKTWTYWDDEEYDFYEAKAYIEIIQKEINKGYYGFPGNYKFGVVPSYENFKTYIN